MLISLYSGMASWVVVPQRVRPTNAAGIHGPLIFEATIHSHLLPADIWARIWSEWERHSFASVSEDLGLMFLAASLDRYGTLLPPFSGTHAAPLIPGAQHVESSLKQG
jgi:hypothetical protein